MGIIISKREYNFLNVEVIDAQTFREQSFKCFMTVFNIGFPLLLIGFILFWTSEYGWQNLEWLPILKRK
jgi:hypothetical protein